MVVEEVAEFGVGFLHGRVLELCLSFEVTITLTPSCRINVSQSHLVVVLVVLNLCPIKVTITSLIDDLKVLSQAQAQILLDIATLDAVIVSDIVAASVHAALLAHWLLGEFRRIVD